MQKILFLVGEQMSANGICADTVMREMVINGYSIHCLTNDEYNYKSSEIKNGIKIKRIKPRLTYRINSWCTHHNGHLSWFLRKVAYILNKAKLIISVPIWPLISPLYSYRFYKAAREIYVNEKYDCIIPIYTQIDTVIASYFIKKKYPEVKFVPYFLDALSGGIGPKVFSKNWTISRGLKWERLLLSIADKIIVMKSSEKHHELISKSESYFSRIKVLDVPLLTERIEIKGSTNILNKKKVNLVFIGSIPYHIRNPKYILEIFKRINIDNCVFTIIGTSTCDNLLKKAQIESIKNEIVLIDKIPHDEAINVLKSADVLVNIGNNISSMVPSKIFEYMSFGKPIISTYPIKDEPSRKYLDDYPLSLQVEEDWNMLGEAVKQVENFIKLSHGVEVDLQNIKKRMYKNTPEAFVDEIRSIIM